MERIRVVLAQNIKYLRKKLGLTQPQLAEKADMSTNYIALIETCNKYPKPEMLERLAEALEVDPRSLFSSSDISEETMDRFYQSISDDMKQMKEDLKQVVQETITKTLNEVKNGKNSKLELTEIKKVVKEAIQETLNEDCKKKK